MGQYSLHFITLKYYNIALLTLCDKKGSRVVGGQRRNLFSDA